MTDYSDSTMEVFAMRITAKFGSMFLLLFLFALTSPAAVLAQEDNTGTNPINFTYDARFYMEMAKLDLDNASMLTNTFEFRAPLGRTLANLGVAAGVFGDLGSRFALRGKFRHKTLTLEEEGNTFGNATVAGLGDLDVRFLAVPYAAGKFGIATGLEAYFPTATHDALGDGRLSLVPQVFLGFFGIMGKNSIFAPGYLYAFDVAGDDHRNPVRQHKIDMYFVWLLAGMKNWLIINPQFNFDTENDKAIYLVDAEFGFMVPQLPGASTWLRPGVGYGGDKPFDWNFEFGMKFIWR